MTPEEIRLIAEYMGFEYGGQTRRGLFFGKKVDYWTKPGYKGYKFFIGFFEYDKSWNWLMRAVGKIRSQMDRFVFVQNSHTTIIRGWSNKWSFDISEEGTDVKTACKAVVRAIQFINDNRT